MVTAAVTGGDVSGKSGFRKKVPARLMEKILEIPEIATALMTHVLPALGRDIDVEPESLARYQKVFGPTQFVAEDFWKMVARAKGKKLVLCDRGIPDMVAYDPGGWPAIEEAFALTKEQILDRYNHVILLRSLAHFDPDGFMAEMEKNPARAKRTVAEAIELDNKIYEAWKDHPGLIEIDCSKGFDEVVRQVEKALRAMMSTEIEIKYYLPRGRPDMSIFEKIIRIEQLQAYLVATKETQLRIRREVIEGELAQHIMTTKLKSGLERPEHEDEDYPEWGFNALLPEAQGHPIEKLRHLAFHRGDNRFYEVDHYRKPAEDFIVEITCDSRKEADALRANMPDWLAAVGAIDVTDVPGFGALDMAKNGRFPVLEAVRV